MTRKAWSGLFRLTAIFISLLLGLTGCSGIRGTLRDVSVRNVSFSGNVYRITSGGRYRFSGEHEGQILIRTPRNESVELIFDGFTLHNPTGPAVHAARALFVEIVLTEGTVNTLSDGEHEDWDANAVVYVRHDLIISGSGTLNVFGNFHNGIRSQDFLIVNGGVINVNAAGDALRGRGGVIINDGVLTLTADGDGIRSNSANEGLGSVAVNGGYINIKAGDDGIQAEANVTVNGGEIIIAAEDDGITARGSVLIRNGGILITDSNQGIEGNNVTVSGGTLNIFSRDIGIDARNSESNRDAYIRFTGGSTHIHSLHDGIDSDDNVFVEGGTLKISGPPDVRAVRGVDLTGEFIVSGGEIAASGSIVNISQMSAQPAIVVSFGQRQGIGALIEIKDLNGETLIYHTALEAFSAAMFTSPRFGVGSTYVLFINGRRIAEIELGETVNVAWV
jgi:hypothetical protein